MDFHHLGLGCFSSLVRKTVDQGLFEGLTAVFTALEMTHGECGHEKIDPSHLIKGMSAVCTVTHSMAVKMGMRRSG
jgi:hypothetical protein